MLLVTAAEMRRLDELTIQRYGTPGHVLMERAGAGAVDVLLAQFPYVRRKQILVVAGKGNNGGDGFVMARLLRKHGVRAKVALLGSASEVKGDAARALAAAKRAKVQVIEISGAVSELISLMDEACLLVDAIFGTGLNAAIEGRYADAVHLMNASGVPIFAVDIASGLQADTGYALGSAIQAEATATFGFAKIGQVTYPGILSTGALAIVDIGIASEAVREVAPRITLLEPVDVATLLPVRSAEAHKGVAGHVLVIAGSRGHTGAALLASKAACRSGAGLTTLAGPASLNSIYCSGAPEVMTALLGDEDGLLRFDEGATRMLLVNKTAVVAGPGMGTHDDAIQLVSHLLARPSLPLVLDADALTCVARNLQCLRAAAADAVLTPHPGEMARLIGTDSAAVQSDRLGVARRFAAENRCVVVLKGARTVIAAPDGAAWINPTGNPGMASGGMGDALAGMIGALLAQGLPSAEAARCAVYLHGAAADLVAAEQGPLGFLASDVIAALPRAFAASFRILDSLLAGRKK
ncbi:MAG TPA: NAD(P)H-hydrate dehydratase [Candidatus Acidoferrales bacterium]|nr:NAD(P)H-hydrate dehydratase [Candidatus Acidoferrales bacterium]